MLRYFSALPRAALDRLYGDGWTCQGLLRALPPIARLYAIRLAMAHGSLPAGLVDQWPLQTKEARKIHDEALKVMRRLNLIEEVAPEEEGGEALVRLHGSFSERLLECLCIGGVLDAENERDDDDPKAAGASSAPTIAQLEQHAQATWECVLQAVLSPPRHHVPLAMRCEGASLQELLKEAGLLDARYPGDEGYDDDDDAAAAEGDDASGGEPRLCMSRGARRFLLMPTHAQVWKLVLAYMELAERGTPGTRHATLTFLMRLGLLRLGRGYAMDDASLDGPQRATLADMALLGLVHRPPGQVRQPSPGTRTRNPQPQPGP